MSALPEARAGTPPGDGLSVTESDGWLVLAGEVTVATVPGLRAVCDAAAPDPARLDMAGVGFLDSAGLYLLVTLWKARRLTLRGTAGQPARVIRISGLAAYFGVETGRPNGE